MRFPFVILIAVATLAVYLLNSRYFVEELYLYGFAETKETEINLNYPVVVDKLGAISGQSVSADDTLLWARRLDADIDFMDQDTRISEINAKKRIWLSEQQCKLQTLENNHAQRIEQIDAEIHALDTKIKNQKQLFEGLESVDIDDVQLGEDHPMMLKLERLHQKKQDVIDRYQLEKTLLLDNMKRGNADEEVAIRRLQEEKSFKESTKEIPVAIVAPTDGLVGNVHCKEGEHITDYRTLISFYEPHPTLVKAYLHEDKVVDVQIGDEFAISSVKDQSVSYRGNVIGLGSRIIEIPTRMRKVPEIKVYGREVMVRLPSESKFLQNEKLILTAVNNAK